MNEIDRALGQIARERGSKSENKVLEAILSMKDPWLRAARLSTPEEDADGADIVVSTDVGNLYLQVKSSKCGIQRWRSKNRKRGLTKKRAHIGLIRAHQELVGERLVGVVREELVRMREKYLAEWYPFEQKGE